jgi:hypothetical protein
VIVGDGDELQSPLESLLDACERADARGFENTVFGTVGFANATILERLARLGGIAVTARRGLDAKTNAALLGGRVAKIVGWVRHALSHEHGHQHHHAH